MISLSNKNKAYIKQQLHTIIFGTDTVAGKAFDVILISCIIASVLITIFESSITQPAIQHILVWLEYIFIVFFTAEYCLRIYCSPKPKEYIFSFFGIIDLLSILPTYLAFIFTGASYMIIIRSFRLIRVFRVFKLFSFMNEGNLLLLSLRRSFKKIFVFFFFVLILNICIGTLMYIFENNEPSTKFTNIPNGIYWSIVTMTTVGYGDITPVTTIGKFLSASVMLLGYTIIAVPTGIVSVSLMRENERRKKRICPRCGKKRHEEEATFCSRCGAKLNE